jgi:cell wall-associated NlpC family hydrolase
MIKQNMPLLVLLIAALSLNSSSASAELDDIQAVGVTPLTQTTIISYPVSPSYLMGIDPLDEIIATYNGKVALESAQQETVRVEEWADADAFASKQLLIDQVLAELFSYVGKTPYGFGATPLVWDCSGLTSWYLNELGISVKHSATAQMKNKIKIDSPLPGDLVGFKSAGSSSYYHIGVYIGAGMMIHSGNAKTGTRFTSVSKFSQSENIEAYFVRY